jgi:hypothetical protein
LKNVTIGKGVTFLGIALFKDSHNLAVINLDSENENYIAADGVLFNINKTSMICYPPKKTGYEFTVPESVAVLEWGAFQNNASLTDINIPDSVTRIENDVFQGCVNLTSVVIPDSVTSMGWYTFSECYNLADVKLSDNIQNIRSGMFRNCAKLTSITMPSGTIVIEDAVFLNCTDLKSVYFKHPDGSAIILGKDVFNNVSEDFKIICREKAAGFDDGDGTWHGYPVQKLVYGDADGSGEKNPDDLQTVIDYINGTFIPENEDVLFDAVKSSDGGRIDIEDLMKLRQDLAE